MDFKTYPFLRNKKGDESPVLHRLHIWYVPKLVYLY